MLYEVITRRPAGREIAVIPVCTQLRDDLIDDLRTLHESGVDVIEAIRLLLRIYVGLEQVDDIDHLGSYNFV